MPSESNVHADWLNKWSLLQWQSACLRSLPRTKGVEADDYNSDTQEVEARTSKVSHCHQSHKESEANLRYMKLYLEIKFAS